MSRSTGEQLVSLDKVLVGDAFQSVPIDCVYINHLKNDGDNDIVFKVNEEEFTLKPNEVIVELDVDITKLFYRTNSGVSSFRFLGKQGLSKGTQLVSLEATAVSTETKQLFECSFINHLKNDGDSSITFSVDTKVAEDVNVFTINPGEWLDDLVIPIYSLSYKSDGGASAFRALGLRR